MDFSNQVMAMVQVVGWVMELEQLTFAAYDGTCVFMADIQVCISIAATCPGRQGVATVQTLGGVFNILLASVMVVFVMLQPVAGQGGIAGEAAVDATCQ